MKIFTGKVISKKMEKTATVAVERVVFHPIYKKRIKKVKKFQVHDEFETQIGQMVKFVASKPFSKTKKWKIVDSSEVNKKSSESKKSGTVKKTVKKTRKVVSKKK